MEFIHGTAIFTIFLLGLHSKTHQKAAEQTRMLLKSFKASMTIDNCLVYIYSHDIVQGFGNCRLRKVTLWFELRLEGMRWKETLCCGMAHHDQVRSK